jgi:hypothetical protein
VQSPISSARLDGRGGLIVEWIAITLARLGMGGQFAHYLADLLVVEHGHTDDVGGAQAGPSAELAPGSAKGVIASA